MSGGGSVSGEGGGGGGGGLVLGMSRGPGGGSQVRVIKCNIGWIGIHVTSTPSLPSPTRGYTY